MKIFTGEYELLYSGSVILTKEKSIKFMFPESEASLILILNFTESLEKGNDKKTNEVITKEIVEKTLTMNIPMTKSDGGNNEIMEIGFLKGRRFFLNFRVIYNYDLSPTIQYSFYLGKEVNDA